MGIYQSKERHSVRSIDSVTNDILLFDRQTGCIRIRSVFVMIPRCLVSSYSLIPQYSLFSFSVEINLLFWEFGFPVHKDYTSIPLTPVKYNGKLYIFI